VAPILASSGNAIGDEVFLSYCPERVLPGRTLKEIIAKDRIIGGVNMESARRAEEVYGAFVEGQIYLTDATTAELVKITENTFRDVNIALANELAIVCERLGVDAWEVIELANKHPRVRLHLPGPGVGGHCLPVDPWFVVELFPEVTRLIRTAREVNEQQPYFVVQLILQMLVGLQTPLRCRPD
jgi:UDP-N-acetyl-D-mannosaminuronic acid dehydrogenase